MAGLRDRPREVAAELTIDYSKTGVVVGATRDEAL